MVRWGIARGVGAMVATLVTVPAGGVAPAYIIFGSDRWAPHLHVTGHLSSVSPEIGAALGLSWGLNGVSCTSANACTAVGDGLVGTTVSHAQGATLIEARSGGKWSVQSSPPTTWGTTGQRAHGRIVLFGQRLHGRWAFERLHVGRRVGWSEVDVGRNASPERDGPAKYLVHFAQ